MSDLFKWEIQYMDIRVNLNCQQLRKLLQAKFEATSVWQRKCFMGRNSLKIQVLWDGCKCIRRFRRKANIFNLAQLHPLVQKIT